MQNVTELKSIRAGMFDLELQNGQWIERRDFLTTGNPTRQNSQIAAPEVAPTITDSRRRAVFKDTVSWQ
jgi:hypothetical protein